MIQIAIGKSSNSEHWENVEWTWEQFVQRCKNVRYSYETVAEFHAMSKEQQSIAKNGAAFVGGIVKNGSRKKSNVEQKTLVVLDADHAGERFISDVAEALGDTAHIIYSTHSNDPLKNNKMRVVIPLSRIIDTTEYEAIARYIAAQIGMDYFDHTTFETNRLFYFPSCPSDAIPIFIERGWDWLDVDAILGYYRDYRDRDEWEIHPSEVKSIRSLASEIGDPRNKPNNVGVFCRVYTISAGIEAFLSDVYTPCNASNTRYTYAKGTSFGGCTVHDDDTHFYSRHQSDPANTTSCHNIFDLVRIHKFGHLDDDAHKNTNTAKLPSHIAMNDFVDQDPKCIALKQEEAALLFEKDQTGEEEVPARSLFFDGKRFVPKRLGDWFMLGRFAFVMNKELYLYDKGKYVLGEDLFRKVCTDKLGMEYSPARIRDALTYLHDSLDKYTSDEVLDTPENFLNVKNGLLDLKTFQLLPHSPSFITVSQLEAEYRSDVRADLLYEFFKMVLTKDEIAVMEEVLGCLLTPSMEYEKAILFYGEGQNGKSTMSDLILRFLGRQNVSGASLHELTDNRFAKAGLYGKMANIFPDESGRMMEDSKTFKTLVSGDNVNAEHKGKPAFTFKNRAKLIMSCNEIPKSRDKTDGNFRKYLIIEFPNKFNGKEIRRRLEAWDDLPSAMLNVAILGLKRLRKQGGFTETTRHQQLISNLRADSDSVYAFFRDRVEQTDDPRDKIPVVDLRDAYEAYCRDNGLIPVNRKEYEKGRTRYLKRLEYDTNAGRAIKFVKLVNATEGNSFFFEGLTNYH